MAGRFLIVDPDPNIRATIAAVARAAAIEPVSAGTLAQARAALSGGAPDVALIASDLPDGTGLTMLAVLAETCPETESVMLISGDRPDQVAEAMREGAADFLPRPFTTKELGHVLSRVMKCRARRRAPNESLGAGSALIVDDETITLRILGNFLAEVGFSVMQAANLTEARAALEQRVPDVLVSDVFIEAESGLDFLRETKHRWPYLPVVVVTSSTQSSILLEAIRAEAHTVLIKPLDKGEFQRVVQGARRLRVALEDQSRLQRVVDGFGAGIAYLEETFARMDRASVAAPASRPGRAGEAFDSLPSGIVLFDRERRIVDLNPATCRLLHVSRDQLLGLRLEEARELAPFQEALLQTLATGQTFTNLEGTLHLSGTDHIFGFNTAPLLGTVHEGGALCYFQDITSKKKMEQHLRQTERLASVGLLAAGVTNEISTPLTVATGHTEMLLRSSSDPERVQRHVEKIQEALRQASEFTTKLMRLVKQPESDARPTDLNVALQEAVQLVERKLKLRSQQIELALTAIAAEVIGDPAELQQVFLNLLYAASDRTPGGGTLKLTTANLTGVVEIALQDASTGDGDSPINPDSSPGQTSLPPLLGLALARNIVARFGGVIRSDVVPGAGTTVTVRFPVVSAKLRKTWVVSKTARVRPLGHQGRPAIVLADPGPVADEVKLWLEESGTPVEMRTSAETALTPLSSGQPAVYIVDAACQGTDWLAFLRAAAEMHLAPIVLLLRDDSQRAILAGLGAAAPSRTVPRPLSSESLLQAVALAELELSSPRQNAAPL